MLLFFVVVSEREREIMLRMQWIELPRKWFHWNNATVNPPEIRNPIPINNITDQAQFTLPQPIGIPVSMIATKKLEIVFVLRFFLIRRYCGGKWWKCVQRGFSTEHRPLILIKLVTKMWRTILDDSLIVRAISFSEKKLIRWKKKCDNRLHWFTIGKRSGISPCYGYLIDVFFAHIHTNRIWGKKC